jgi:hypothetical protein
MRVVQFDSSIARPNAFAASFPLSTNTSGFQGVRPTTNCVIAGGYEVTWTGSNAAADTVLGCILTVEVYKLDRVQEILVLQKAPLDDEAPDGEAEFMDWLNS